MSGQYPAEVWALEYLEAKAVGLNVINLEERR